MKVTFDIECTPAEARAFLGLPDVAPLQDKMMEEMEKRMSENLSALDPESVMKLWMPMGIESWSEMQKLFLAQMGLGGSAGQKDDPEKK